MRFALNPKHLSKVSIILFFILLSACKKDKPAPVVPPEIIMIVGSDSATNKCIMQDVNGNAAGTFIVDAGKKIQWLVQTNTVNDVTDVYKKTGSENIFSELPHRLGNSSNWEGTVDSSASGKEEGYNIDWTDQVGNKHTYDPKIQVR